jgi:hypothetical protein
VTFRVESTQSGLVPQQPRVPPRFGEGRRADESLPFINRRQRPLGQPSVPCAAARLPF